MYIGLGLYVVCCIFFNIDGGEQRVVRKKVKLIMKQIFVVKRYNNKFCIWFNWICFD